MISLNSEGVRLANTENCCIAAARRPKEDALPEPLVLADPATTGPLDWKSVIDRPPSIVHLFCFRFCFRIRQHIASPSNREGRIRALGDNQALTCYWVLLTFDLSHRLGKIFPPVRALRRAYRQSRPREPCVPNRISRENNLPH